MAIPLLEAATMRELDRRTIQEVGIPGPVLMEVAGRACAEGVEKVLGGHRPARIAVICGKGNNGGDGFVAARHLHHGGHLVDVFLCGKPDQLKGDADLNKKILDRIQLPVFEIESKSHLSALDLSAYDVILDALLGTGLESAVRGLFAEIIGKINESGVPVVSVDIPSGISSDTGCPMGVAVRASQTITFACPKPGHVVYPGCSYTGDLTVVDIGIPPGLFPDGPGTAWLLNEDDLAGLIQKRDPAAHKGHFGHLVVVAGSVDKPGAAGLCCRAAVRSGAGLVTLAASRPVLDHVVLGAVEYMGEKVSSFASLRALCRDKQAVVIGPGLGTSKEVKNLVRQAVSGIQLPMVVDADGLNNLAGDLGVVRRANSPRILTPHPGEMARLLGTTSKEIQEDRLNASRALAKKCDCVVVLKGAGSIVAQEDGTAFVIGAGNPGMASGGTGDVLTGVIGSFLAQGMGATEAAAVGTYVHALAGDRAGEASGQRGLTASDIIVALPAVLRSFEFWQDRDDSSNP